MRSVFVLTQKPSRMQSTPDEYAVEHAYPIISGFAISMSQPRQSVINLSAQPPGSGFAFNQPKKGALLFCWTRVVIWRGEPGTRPHIPRPVIGRKLLLVLKCYRFTINDPLFHLQTVTKGTQST